MIELVEFIKSQDFIKGIYVEIAGGIIQGIFIIVFIPIALAIYNRIRFSPTNFLVSFEVLRIFQGCLSLFVKISFNDNRLKTLIESLCNKEFESISNHRYYGTLKDDLFLMTTKIDQDSILAQIKSKTTRQVEEIVEELNRLLEQMEKLSYMMSFHPKRQELFYRLRALFFPLRDGFESIKQNPSQMDLAPFGNMYTIPKIMIDISHEVERLSKKPMNTIDGRIRYQSFISYLRLIGVALKNFISRPKKES